LKHDDGSWTHLGHLKAGSVATGLLGTRVVAGTKIGELGNSGFSGGPHLHVHRQFSDDPMDPHGVAIDMHFTNVVRPARFDGAVEIDVFAWPDHFVAASPDIALPHPARRGDVLDLLVP
jgi:hypothetical protein